MSVKAGMGREAGVATTGTARTSDTLEMSEKSGTDMMAFDGGVEEDKDMDKESDEGWVEVKKKIMLDNIWEMQSRAEARNNARTGTVKLLVLRLLFVKLQQAPVLRRITARARRRACVPSCVRWACGVPEPDPHLLLSRLCDHELPLTWFKHPWLFRTPQTCFSNTSPLERRNLMQILFPISWPMSSA